jgi:hypothetical protein
MWLISGCATTAPIPGAKQDLLEFLHVGQTTREQVLITLGQPSAAFEQEKILTYRLGHDAGQGYYIITPRQLMSWQSVRYSLVLVFDANGVLRTHNLVDVQ